MSPYDRLIHDRGRAEKLFGFEYYLEMYEPADKRRWGYVELPILYGDKLVGKLDTLADRNWTSVSRAERRQEPAPSRILIPYRPLVVHER